MLEVSERMIPRRSTQDWLLEAVAFAALIATFAMVFGHWQRLPGFARRGSGGSRSRGTGRLRGRTVTQNSNEGAGQQQAARHR